MKTPKHDEIVLWCFENWRKIIKAFKLYDKDSIHWFHRNGNSEWDWNTNKATSNSKKEVKKIEKDYKKFLEEVEKNDGKVNIEKIIEYRLTNDKGWNIGFIDLMFKLRTHCSSTEYFSTSTSKEYKMDESYKEIFLEIKPKVNSIGEVMRQINYYRTIIKDAPIILVTESEGISDIFNSQKVFVYQYNKLKDSQKKL